MEKINKKQISIIVVIIAVIAIIIYSYYKKNNENNYMPFEETEKNSITQTKEENKEKEQIIIHIAGEVENPGIVKIEEGGRIIDAINEAGGLTEKADISKINLAYVLEDGEKIYIPYQGEKTSETEESVGTESTVRSKRNTNKHKHSNTKRPNPITRNRKLNSTKNNRIQKTKRKIQNNRRHKKRKWNR